MSSLFMQGACIQSSANLKLQVKQNQNTITVATALNWTY